MSEKPKKQFHGRKTLSGWMDFPLKKIQRKRGFAESRLLTDWKSIVGAALAQHCAPQKLSFPKDQHGATLHVICEPGWATELQFQQEIVCDKIATFFGYRAVGSIRIHQGQLPARTAAPKAPPAFNPDDAPEALQAEVSAVENDELKNALLRLGLSLDAKRNSAMKDTDTSNRSSSDLKET